MAKKRTVSLKKARAEVEAAEKVAEAEAKTGKKKAATKTAKKKETDKDGKAKEAPRKKAVRKTKKAKPPIRFRLIWGVYSSSMKEEARFPYDQRADADKKAEQLKSKGKKLFWVQPIKEEIEPEPESEDK